MTFQNASQLQHVHGAGTCSTDMVGASVASSMMLCWLFLYYTHNNLAKQ